MARLQLVVASALFSLVAACASNASSVRPYDPFDDRAASPEEREEALETLMERAEANADNPNVDAPREIPLRLEPTTAEPLVGNSVRRSQVDQFLELGPHAVFGVVMLSPAREGNALLGFRIDEVYQGGEYVLAGGLERGDIVRTVNGTSVLNPDDVMAIWESMSTAESIDVEYIRDGEALELHYDIVSDVAAVDCGCRIQ